MAHGIKQIIQMYIEQILENLSDMHVTRVYRHGDEVNKTTVEDVT